MVSKLMYLGIEWTLTVFRKMKAIPLDIYLNGKYIKFRNVSRRDFIFWVFICLVYPTILELHFIVYSYNTLSKEEDLTNLEMQRILVCLVFAFSVFISLALNIAALIGIKDFGGIVCEGFRTDVDFEGKYKINIPILALFCLWSEFHN